MFRYPTSQCNQAVTRNARVSGPGTILAVALTLACSGNRTSSGAEFQTGVMGDAILQVTSRHDHHVEVSVRPLDGSVFVLGTVRVLDQRSFRLPRTMNGRPTRVILRCVETGEIFETQDIAWGARERFTLAVALLLPLSDLGGRL